jgi:hypothetical protein
MLATFRSLRAVAGIVIAVLAAASPANTMEMAPVACKTVPAVVRAPDERQAASACEGAHAALSFLSDMGVLPVGTVHIDLVEQLPAGTSPTAVGCYLHATGRISTLTYERFLERKTWFGIAIDRELHRAVIAHETAHAVAGCVPGAGELSVVAQEYVAYVTMFATMPEPLRQRVLASVPGTGFDQEEQINLLVYAFDPMQFGAESWRHFERQPDRAQFLQRVLAGKMLRDPFAESMRGDSAR